MSEVAGPGSRGHARDCGELATAIAIARDAIGRGGTADLEALVERLGELLDGIARAPGGEAAAHRRQLLGLAEELEALASLVGLERQRCSEALARGGASARAVAAYAKATRF